MYLINNNRKTTISMKTLAIAIITILATTFSAQATATFAPLDTIKEIKSVVGAFEMDVELSAFGELEAKSADAVFVRQPKDLPTDFTGYKIEVIRVYNQPLGADDNFLQVTGGVCVEKIGENTYAYLIGNFNTKQGMLDFLNTVIKPEHRNAKAIVYKKGLRVKEIQG